MSRCIDADALIEGYKHMGYDPTEHPEESYMEGWCKGFNSAIDHCMHHVIHAPTIEPEPQWIPCSKALPKTNGVYVVTRNISDGFECRNITDACYFDGTNTWHDDTRVNHSREYLTDVLAWMPLPECYREGE